MMSEDVFGQDTNLASNGALGHWNDTMRAFLAHSAATPEHLGQTLAADPQFALGHAVKGLFLLLLGRLELVDTAREALAAAEAAAANTATERESLYVLALREWLDGRPSGAIGAMEKILSRAPADTLAMKLDHAIRFVLGDGIGMRRAVEAVLPAYGRDHPGRGYVLGCHAFALEETGDYLSAETMGRAGLELCPDDVWGLHAVAHVYEMTGNSRGGLTWLSGREEAWAHCNNFRYHVWWHKALMHLDQGEVSQVLDLYDRLIRADHTDDYRDISNATSLLARLELEGVDVQGRWEELADISERRTEDGCLVFADLHYLLALVGGGRRQAIGRLLGRMQRDAKGRATELAQRFAAPGLSAAAGLDAFGEGNYASAFLNLAKARKSMQLAGGSHAQRDVFERLTIDAGIRSGHLDEAETMLIERTTRRAGRDDRYAAARRDMIEDGRFAARYGDRLSAQ